MKKLVLSIFFIFIAIVSLGCNRVDKVDNVEYAKRLAEAVNTMKLNSESSPVLNLNGSGDEYIAEVLKETLDINKKFVESISLFNSKDSEIAQLHDNFIQMNLEHQNAIKEYIKILDSKKSNSNLNDDLMTIQKDLEDATINMTNSFYSLSDLFLQKSGIDLMEIYY